MFLQNPSKESHWDIGRMRLCKTIAVTLILFEVQIFLRRAVYSMLSADNESSTQIIQMNVAATAQVSS